MLMAKVHNGNIGRRKHILNDFFSVGKEMNIMVSQCQ
jgi:hypothetical protein